MAPLHTPEEIVQLSNAAHVTEGIVLALFAVLVAAQGFGYVQKSRQRYVVPGIALFASVVLIGFLFFDHLAELPRAWEWITTDMQQRQHLQMGILLGIGSIIALVGLKLRQPKFMLAMHVSLALIGYLFIVHPQHGTTAEAAKALFIHRVAGAALIVAGIGQAAALFYDKWRKPLVIIAAVGLALSGVLFMVYREPLMQPDMMQPAANHTMNVSQP